MIRHKDNHDVTRPGSACVGCEWETPTQCGCGRRLVVVPICVLCRRERDDCKCPSLTE